MATGKLFGTWGIALVALMVTTGGAMAAPANVIVGTVGGLTDAGIFIAHAKGYFKEQSITVDYKIFASSSDFMPALGSGQLDVAGIIISAGLFNSVANGINLRMVGDKQSVLKGFTTPVFIMRKDLYDAGRYQKLNEFKGLRFALSAKPSFSFFTAVEWAKKKGLREKDVNWVELGYPQMMPAIQSKSVDMLHIIEPFTSKILESDLAVLVGDAYEVTPGATAVGLVYSETFATKKRGLGQKFMVAYMKGVRDYNDAYRKNKNRAEIAKILADATKTEPALVEKMRKGGLDPDQKIEKKWITATQDFLYDHKYVQKKIDIDRLIDTSFADYAVKQLGGVYKY